MLRLALAVGLAIAVGACGPKVVALTERPQQFYEQQVKIVGRVSRSQAVGDEVLIELADADERRILARVAAKDAPPLESWVEVRGVFVAELRLGDRIVYDVIAVERVSEHHAPWFPYLF
jgi:uncharacterized membrane protein YcgQ (UPF0703/DUF1980 family)